MTLDRYSLVSAAAVVALAWLGRRLIEHAVGAWLQAVLAAPIGGGRP